MKLPITSITPFTFQDYPEHTACILWFSGCNMACSYCHNPELARGELRKLSFEKVQEFLESRRGLLEGVVLSGGECTLCLALPKFAEYLRGLGYKIKIDTNGTNPDMLARLLEEDLVDFIALDFKAPEPKFPSLTGFGNYELFRRSLEILCAAKIASEIRTTVHADLLDANDINSITRQLEDCKFLGKYFIQKFRAGKTLGSLAIPARDFDITKLALTNFETLFRNF